MYVNQCASVALQHWLDSLIVFWQSSFC